MRDLSNAIPDVDVLLAMEPEELGAKLLFILRRRLESGSQYVHRGNYLNEANNERIFPPEKKEAVQIAVTEAWFWLQAQGMIIPAPDSNGNSGFCILSRRARSFQDERTFAAHQVSRLLPKEILHARFADIVWSSFIRGEYDSAVFQAMKAVEVYVRDATRLDNSFVGVKLMTEAFKPEGGILTDAKAEGSERAARLQLFHGAIGSYKNPNSHRDVNMEDPLEAVEIILLANHLMKIVDARVAELDAGGA